MYWPAGGYLQNKTEYITYRSLPIELRGPTLTRIILSTPSSIALTSSYLRARSYIAILTRELTGCIVIHCIVMHCCIPRTYGSCTTGWWRHWTCYHCDEKGTKLKWKSTQRKHRRNALDSSQLICDFWPISRKKQNMAEMLFLVRTLC